MNFLYVLLTTPGVVFHELGHAVFCFLANVKIYRIKLFGFKNPLGFVEHEEPQKFIPSLLISFGPLAVNSLVGLILFSQLTYKFTALNLILLWLGLAVALHSIPSNGDAHTLLLITRRKLKRNPLVVVGFPFVGLIYFLNFLKRYHIHFIYAVVLFWLGNIYLK